LEYSRNLLFASGAVMDRVFDTVVDRTRCRLDVPKLRTLFGTKGRPHRRPGVELSPRQAVVIERPRWNLTIFKVHFGLLTLKAYTKGEHVLRFEAIVHAGLRPGAGAFPGDRHPPRRDGRRFTTMLDCLDIGFIPDGILDQLPAPSQIGATRVGGVDVNKTRIRAALAAVLAPAIAPAGFTVAGLTAKVHALTGQTESDYTTRQGAYDLRKLRGKQLVAKPGRTRHDLPCRLYGDPPRAATIHQYRQRTPRKATRRSRSGPPGVSAPVAAARSPRRQPASGPETGSGGSRHLTAAAGIIAIDGSSSRRLGWTSGAKPCHARMYRCRVRLLCCDCLGAVTRSARSLSPCLSNV